MLTTDELPTYDVSDFIELELIEDALDDDGGDEWEM